MDHAIPAGSKLRDKLLYSGDANGWKVRVHAICFALLMPEINARWTLVFTTPEEASYDIFGGQCYRWDPARTTKGVSRIATRLLNQM